MSINKDLLTYLLTYNKSLFTCTTTYNGI